MGSEEDTARANALFCLGSRENSRVSAANKVLLPSRVWGVVRGKVELRRRSIGVFIVNGFNGNSTSGAGFAVCIMYSYGNSVVWQTVVIAECALGKSPVLQWDGEPELVGRVVSPA